METLSGGVSADYAAYVARKSGFILALCVVLAVSLVAAIALGAADIPVLTVIKSLLGSDVGKRFDLIIWNIRLPQALSAIVAGAGLSVSGAVMQSILRNPLGSPFTLGISHAAAFGAAFSVMIMGAGVMASSNTGAITIVNPYTTTAAAFAAALIAAMIVVGVAKSRGATPEVMVLTGVALGALFTAGTMFLQYFADDVQLAAMVFWTFGDTARASWNELAVTTVITVLSSAFFMVNAWNYNAVDAGDETAKGLGVRIERVRMIGMLTASMVTAVIIAFMGIIGFVGLVVPHMVRRVIGADHRFLLPACIVGGGALLLVADTAARLVLAPRILPVSVLTAFLGAPVFIVLILRGRR